MGDQSGPRYEQIAIHLRSLVATGQPGDRLPSDAQLCEMFSVSRMTARHAVAQLENEGLLYRRRGQGTFISPRPVLRMLGSPLSFTESMRRRGRAASSRVLETASIEPSEEDRQALNLRAGQRPFLVRRLRLADGVPMAIERAVLAPDCGDVLHSDLATTSLHAAFERMGRLPTRAEAFVTARLADAGERRLLELTAPAVLLSERRVITDQHSAPLEHTETLYAAERYVFETVLHRDATETI
ncbi:MAG TPA: GntR family transcriptional regulator [Acidimicrobiia bacterium]